VDITTELIETCGQSKNDWLRTAGIPTLLLCLGLLLIGPGVQSSHAQSIASDNLAPYGPNLTETGQIVLGAGDVVDVTVFNTVELSARLRVDQAGKVDLPVVGLLEVAGLNSNQAARAVEKRLRDGQIMLDPHVTVQIFQFATQGITLMGEVHAPGTYPLFGPHTLYEALSFAGGPTQNEGSTITITHHSDPTHPLVIQVKSTNYSAIQNSTPVFPGDTIVVAQADFVYVIGDVNAPGAYSIPLGRDLSLLNILALCHGWTLTASASKATIIRKTATGTETIPIDFNQVVKNAAPNLVLQASDVLVMPHSGFKRFLQYALPSATSSAFSAGVDVAVIK
jgi:polysaccharide export outer membrane protein